jgi:hypothetical protein
VRGWPASLPALALLAVLACALAGCGLGAGSTPSAVRLTVTRDFGTRVLHASVHPNISGQDTVMSLLLRNYHVSTRYGGGFVQGIGGVEGGEAGGHPVDWFYYVNGVEAQKGASDTNVHQGDSIWWDLHDWSATQDVPAVVGSYPEPFLHGMGGKRFPVRVECSRAAGAACGTVATRLQRAGVPAAIGALGAGGGPQLLRVLVGPWREVRAERELQSIEKGPRASGVYAEPNAAGTTITLLDQNGSGVSTLGAGSGLIAATAGQERVPLWAVTGTDAAGVQRAAEALSEADLRNRFALAVSAAGPQPVPVAPGAAP